LKQLIGITLAMYRAGETPCCRLGWSQWMTDTFKKV
jgi:hypothetical protein